jgi:gluconokinase
MKTQQLFSVVVMGVAGCGKSSVGAALATRLALPFTDGDDHHSAQSREKMRAGVALTDADRADWLATLAARLQRFESAEAASGVVLACSALRKSYRDTLRAASPALRVLFLDITPAQSRERVSARDGHFFSATLVDSQFATLEPPTNEPNVLRLDGAQPLAEIVTKASAWMMAESQRTTHRAQTEVL